MPDKSSKKKERLLKPAAGIFGDSSSEDDEKKSKTAKVNISLSQSQKKQDKLVQEKALAEDATIYQYDEVYDDIEQARNEAKNSKKDPERKPKYINKLLEAADKRKKDQERRIERQVQKERDEEGEMFKDKESFVTSAYREKLEEMRKAEEEEKRQDYLESIGDVTKQKDLDGFYRHIYAQKMGDEKEQKTEPSSTEIAEKFEEKDSKHSHSEKEKKERSYRKRKNSGDKEKSDDDESEVKKDKKAHLVSNLDADSDFSIDDSSSDSEGEGKSAKEIPENQKKVDDSTLPKTEPNNVPETNGNGNTCPADEDSEKDKKPPPAKKPKIDIWKKRTVGEVFDDAVKRFYERKALRESG